MPFRLAGACAMRRMERLARSARVLAALCAGLALWALTSTARAATPPPGFVDEVLPFTFDVPTALAFLPDGRLLVAEKGGIVYVVDGAQRHSLWVRENEVLNTDDRGLLSVAVDPDFATTRALYFLYVCDPDSNGIELDNYADTFARLTRYQLASPSDTVVDYGTRTILIGTGWPDGFISASGSHNIADLTWGRDGSLLVSCGDGAHFTVADAGGLDPGQFGPGRSNPAEDLGAFRSQSLTSLSGKVLRIDRATGLGLPSNPFWDGNPASARSRVWAYGLRNPFRVTCRPGTGSTDPSLGDPGTLVIGEVGWRTWEELNVAAEPGMNFGWPCFEGFAPQPEYQAATPFASDCSTIGTPVNPSQASVPWAAFSHTDADSSEPPGPVGGAIVGGVYYTGTSYPLNYRDNYFFGDYVTDWIKRVVPAAGGGPPTVIDFVDDADGPVAFTTDPSNGDLYYAALYTGQIHRIRYAGGVAVADHPSHATIALSAPRPNPARGAVTFSLTLAREGPVAWEVLDAGGRRVWSAPGQARGAGHHLLSWPGLTSTGEPVRPGVYHARVRAGDASVMRRFAVLR